MPTGISPHELNLFVYYQSLYYLCNASQRLRRRSTAATNQARCSNLRDFSVYAPSCFLVTTGLSQVKGRSVAGALKLRRKSPPFVSQVLIFSLTCDRFQPSVHSSVAGRPNFEDPRRYFDPPATQNVTSLLFRFRRTYTSCRVETDRTKVHKKGRCQSTSPLFTDTDSPSSTSPPSPVAAGTSPPSPLEAPPRS